MKGRAQDLARPPLPSLPASAPESICTAVRTAGIIAWVVAATGALGALVIGLSVFGRSGNAGHRVARLWARSILAVSRVPVSVRGLERLEAGRAYIFMSNHQSNFDIPVLLGHLPVQFRWLAKAELFRIPLFGRAMRGAGYISIDRSDRDAAFRSLRAAAATIRGGASIMIFPEGTRSTDGTLKPFKKGGFVMAIEAGVPIVPVAIRGTYEIMAKANLLIHPRAVTLDIGAPIATDAYTAAGKEALMDAVRNAIRTGMERT